MKKIILLPFLCFFLNLGFSQTHESFFKDTDDFLKKYVINGRVDYASILNNGKAELNALITFIELNSYDKTIEKAYLIDAYNLLVINEIIKVYPTDSPMSVPGFFDNKIAKINGQVVSLNTLENDLLRKVYKDPRFHFVLVCGGLGCPPITNFAYVPNKLEEQLESQTKLALNNDTFVYQKEEEKTVYLSEIFKWYVTDFGGNNKAAVAYVNTYRTNKFTSDYKVKNYPYDWTINKSSSTRSNSVAAANEEITSAAPEVFNLQTFTAGSLLRKGQSDFTLFNTLYTQTKSNWMGEDFVGPRQTFVTHLLQVTYGISENKRINIGLDINFRSSGKSDDLSSGGISEAFRYKNSETSRVGITSVGARVKVQPIKELADFTIQSTALIPTVKFPEGGGPDNLFWADWNRFTWWNQFFYTKTYNKFQLFTEVDLLFRFKVFKEQTNALDIPLNVFLSYFPTNKITFYVMSQHVPRFAGVESQESTDFITGADYTASGAGFKYQFSRGLNVELLYTNFWRATNNGLGSTFNIGIKYITK